ncbi:MAG: anhydro-N-acetylmuramic acid kinase [Arenicellales bacterium]
MSSAYIGLMSGTSADAIDGVAAEIDEHQARILATVSIPLADTLRQRVQAVSTGTHDRLDDVAVLDIDMGNAFADCAEKLMAELKTPPIAIGCHGQTVRHRPEQHFTVQLGQGGVIAARTGIPTVSDFRSVDVALGGEGAPLVPAFHRAMFGSDIENRAIINIGGIANVTLLAKDGSVRGFDTGPGNTLLDHWYRQHKQGALDDRGQWSRQGRIDVGLLKRCCADPYFSLPAPKSTGPEYFNVDWLEVLLAGHESPVNVQATLRALTSRTISGAVRQHLPGVQRIYLCGGGVRNDALIEELRMDFDGLTVDSTAALGMDPQWVEACAFAWLAHQRLTQQPGNIPAVTGATRPAVLGALYQP